MDWVFVMWVAAASFLLGCWSEVRHSTKRIKKLTEVWQKEVTISNAKYQNYGYRAGFDDAVEMVNNYLKESKIDITISYEQENVLH